MASRKLSKASFVGLVRRLHEGPDSLEGLLERHVVKGEVSRPRLTSTRREVLSLYRNILRASRLFVWPNEQGVAWRDVLRSSARKEIEAAKFETDPEIIAKLLVGGWDAVDSVLEKFEAKAGQVLGQPSADRSPR